MRLLARAVVLNGFLLFLAIGLWGCATSTPRGDLPITRLSPSSLGFELSGVQTMSVTVGGQTRSFDVALEVDGDSVRMAIMQLGQTVAKLTWNGKSLDEKIASGWSRVVSAQRVLSDLQFVWWPEEQVRNSLPEGWRLTQLSNERCLWFEGYLVTSATIVAPGQIELKQYSIGYTVQIYGQEIGSKFDLK